MEYVDDRDINLILAAEEFNDDEFENYHTFYDYEENIIRQLMAHGSVLLKGARGSGKSTLLREAASRLNQDKQSSTAYGISISLRHLPLLRTMGEEYENELLKILINKIHEMVKFDFDYDFISESNVYEVQRNLSFLSESIRKERII